jgi:SanA protein
MLLRKYIKKVYWISITVFICIIAIIFFANYTVTHTTNGLVYNDCTDIPKKKVGLLLGTSKRLRNGNSNQYFSHRITAAVELYRAGKIEMLVISGDNSSKGYNEPEDMKQELLKQGIPESHIYLDYAGFRTFDSVIRMKQIFGQDSFIVISQEFHNRRAIYIAQAKGLHAIGYNAQDVFAYNGFKTQLREKFARVKLFLDLWTGKVPKFLGEEIKIP